MSEKAEFLIYRQNQIELLIIFIGLFAGLFLAFGFVLIKDYFNDKIKSPADIQNENINVLAWIPQIENNSKKEF